MSTDKNPKSRNSDTARIFYNDYRSALQDEMLGTWPLQEWDDLPQERKHAYEMACEKMIARLLT